MFYWRIIALQYYAGFCHTSAWISHRYTHIPSLSRPTPSHSSRLFQSHWLSFLSHTEIQNYGTLYKSACHPCTGAVLIFSASFQFYYVCCQSTPLNSFSSKSKFSPRLTQLPFSQGPHLPLTKHSLWPRCWGQHLLFVISLSHLTSQEIPWRSSGWDSLLSLPRAQVQSLVGELKSHKLSGMTNQTRNENTSQWEDSLVTQILWVKKLRL